MSFNNFVVFVTVCVSYSMAANITDIKLKYLQYVLECATEHYVSRDDIRDLATHRVVKGDNIKCMLACAYKKTGMVLQDLKHLEVTSHASLGACKTAEQVSVGDATDGRQGYHKLNGVQTDEEGKLSIEGMKEIAETAYSDDAEKKKKSEDFTKTCLRVNEEEINGERQECERAAKIFKCATDNFDSAV